MSRKHDSINLVTKDQHVPKEDRTQKTM